MDESVSRSALGRFLLASFAAHAFALALLHWNAAEPQSKPKPPPILYLRLSDLPDAAVPMTPGPVASAPVAPPKTAPKPRATTKPKPLPAPVVAATSLPSPEPAPPAPAAAPSGEALPGAANPNRALASAGLPGVASGPSLEEQLKRYEAELARRIAAHKQYPDLARRRGIEGSVTLRLSIDAQGRLEALETPGRAPLVLVSQARSAAERAAPFPPPPHGPLRIDFVLRFDLDE